MKLKQTPGDFCVEELTAVTWGERGPFALYRLRKTGWTTPDAMQIICRRFNVSWSQLSYGGLKDRHAETVQYLTIHHGPMQHLHTERLELTHLGQRQYPFTSRDIAANRFAVVLRSLAADDVQRVLRRCAEVDATGVPNYFDDQRFGSVTADGRFIGKLLVLGQFEEALKIALCEPYEFDRSETKIEKAILREHWGDWPTCKAKLPKGHARSLVTYLCDHPTKFKGAVERLRPELQGMYLSAYQSDLWNRLLAGWIRTYTSDTGLSHIQQHRALLPVPTAPDADWAELMIPLPSPKVQLPPDSPLALLYDAVLAEEQLALKQFKVPGLDKPFFSRGERAAALWPRHLCAEPAPDDINRGREKLTLHFDLPRGAYATLVVKCLTEITPTTPVRE